MPELDHHPESESRYSCEKCEDSGVTKDEREYCSCHLGAARKNSDRFAEMLRGVPHTEAIWTATHATMKAERATAAAEKAVLNMQLNGYAKDTYAKDLRIAELERELAEVRKDAWQPIETAQKDTTVWAFNGEQGVMQWSEGEGWALWVWTDELLSDADPSPDQPTHWMPLPAPPAASVAQAKKEQGNG